MQYLAASPTAVLSTDAWITFFPSDIVEPEAVDAARSDPFISDGGKKPISLAGPYDAAVKDPAAGVKTFLDGQSPRSLALVSFGTLVDAGHGADVLFEELAAKKVPFVLAGGGQKSSFPESTRKLIQAAEEEGRAVAPDWVDVVAVLAHPVREAPLALRSHHRLRCASSLTVGPTPPSKHSRRASRSWYVEMTLSHTQSTHHRPGARRWTRSSTRR